MKKELIIALGFMIVISAFLVLADNGPSCNTDSDCVSHFSHCSCKNVCGYKNNLSDCNKFCNQSQIDLTRVNCSCIDNKCRDIMVNPSDIAEKNKNMTFLQCVSDSAKIKNDCYGQAKEIAKNCSSKKAGEKIACQKLSKDSVDSCKSSFKTAKDSCNQIKHSWWEGFKARFI